MAVERENYQNLLPRSPFQGRDSLFTVKHGKMSKIPVLEQPPCRCHRHRIKDEAKEQNISRMGSCYQKSLTLRPKNYRELCSDKTVLPFIVYYLDSKSLMFL